MSEQHPEIRVGDGAAAAATAPAGEGRQVKDPAQYGLCAALALLGAYVLFDASGIADVATSNDPLGPKPMPILLGVLLIIVSVFYAVDVSRGGTGDAEEGEDIDLSAPVDWRTIGLLIAAFYIALNIVADIAIVLLIPKLRTAQ